MVLLPREVTIIRRLKRVMGMPVTDIAEAVGRNKSTIYKALDKTWAQGKRGKPRSLQPQDVARLVRTIKDLVSRAKAR